MYSQYIFYAADDIGAVPQSSMTALMIARIALVLHVRFMENCIVFNMF